MKAWEDIERELRSKLYSTSYSKYWIGSGVKIEKMNTGEIIITDFLCHGDDCERVLGRDLDPFLEHGWEVGVRMVRIKHLNKDLNAQKKASVHDLTKKEIQKREKNIFGIETEIKLLIEEIKFFKNGRSI